MADNEDDLVDYDEEEVRDIPLLVPNGFPSPKIFFF